MTRWWFQRMLCCAVLCCAVLWVPSASLADANDATSAVRASAVRASAVRALTVRSKTSLHVTQYPSTGQVSVQLKDDVGEALAEQLVTVRVVNAASEVLEETTAHTDAKGRVVLTCVVCSGQEQTRVTALFEGDVYYDASDVTEEGVPPLRSRWAELWMPLMALVSVTFVVGFLLLQLWVSSRVSERAAKRVGKRVGIHENLGRSQKASLWVVSGRVIRHAEESALAGAHVTLTLSTDTANTDTANTDAAGWFKITVSAPGAYDLKITASGYVPAETLCALPHHGAWSEMTIRLESWRHHVESVFIRSMRRHFPQPLERSRWSVMTHQEAAEHVVASRRVAAKDFAKQVDRVRYGAEEPTALSVQKIQTTAEHIEQDADADAET